MPVLSENEKKIWTISQPKHILGIQKNFPGETAVSSAQNICSEEKAKSVQTLRAIILLDSLNIDKTLSKHKIYLISYKCEFFNNNSKTKPLYFIKITNKRFNIKIQITDSKISLVPLRRFRAVSTDIIVLVIWLGRILSPDRPNLSS